MRRKSLDLEVKRYHTKSLKIPKRYLGAIIRKKKGQKDKQLFTLVSYLLVEDTVLWCVTLLSTIFQEDTYCSLQAK